MVVSCQPFPSPLPFLVTLHLTHAHKVATGKHLNYRLLTAINTRPVGPMWRHCVQTGANSGLILRSSSLLGWDTVDSEHIWTTWGSPWHCKWLSGKWRPINRQSSIQGVSEEEINVQSLICHLLFIKFPVNYLWRARRRRPKILLSFRCMHDMRLILVLISASILFFFFLLKLTIISAFPIMCILTVLGHWKGGSLQF